MTEPKRLRCSTDIRLLKLPEYLHLIVDRLASFDAAVVQTDDSVTFEFPFASARFDMTPEQLTMEASSPDEEGLRRAKELLGVAVELYAKSEKPQFVWTGDLAGDTTLSSFRLMRVERAWQVTPGMRRVRLTGSNLERFDNPSSMHIRMYFPTADVPEPVWPIAGPNGLTFWPSEERKPVARVYTIREMDAKAGYIDVDFVVHGDGDGAHEGVGCGWSMHAKEGDEVGIMGPLGRPVRPADWYIMGCDETGLPALSRILERLPADARGHAFVEVAQATDEQPITHPEGIELRWIHRNGVPGGEHGELVRAIRAVEWPKGVSSFGWFASENEATKEIREYWRDTLSYGRDQTLAAGYWRRGVTGLMAG
ncbi:MULTISPECIES: siderophore-interacting protein [unclassified Rhizobium]|uniref:siderophore-interacting protein n=1 Tax=unclassified Rhizobium TaxID=2613769 RepID=UPI001ADA62A0|nr:MULTISPECIES: siderophore-interacting protein [unclassified Rhizobium]MBO9126825.1 siderophore-interacting protein [Rhizobium sp. 16-488-2b]MBO9177272.1 siderophore-interacting protein [Rhizobium sp. 16-488-2a]